jgi:hypothetical protein
MCSSRTGPIAPLVNNSVVLRAASVAEDCTLALVTRPFAARTA